MVARLGTASLFPTTTTSYQAAVWKRWQFIFEQPPLSYASKLEFWRSWLSWASSFPHEWRALDRSLGPKFSGAF